MTSRVLRLCVVALTGYEPQRQPTAATVKAHVAVARQRAFTKPIVDTASKTYRAGHLSVELLVFDLETAAPLGGFIVDAKTPASLEGRSAQTDIEKYP